MGDWLKVFGTFHLDLPANIGVDNYFLQNNRKSLVVSILSAGNFVGTLLAFPMGDLVGRKWGIVASCAIFSLGVRLQLDTHWPTFIVGRVIAGIGVVCGGALFRLSAIVHHLLLGSRFMSSPHVSIRGMKYSLLFPSSSETFWPWPFSAPIKNCMVSLSDSTNSRVSFGSYLLSLSRWSRSSSW